MTEPAGTQILETKVVESGPRAARVELTIADAPSLEAASETIVLSVNIDLHNDTRPFLDYKRLALHRAIDILREHSRPMDQVLDN